MADLFHWCLVYNWDVHELLHYLDDYFTLGPPASNICAKRLTAIDQAATEIGIPLSPDKCVGPTTCLVFLGIELDSIQMTARLPADKRTELTQMLDERATKRWCTLKDLQSLVGKLNHACAVVPQGRTFVRRLLDLLKGHSSKRSLVAYMGRRILFLIYQLGPQSLTFSFPPMHQGAMAMARFTREHGLMVPFSTVFEHCL